MNFRHVGLVLGLFLSLVGGVPSFANSLSQVQVSFPLQGYYRPGKYMPVRVRTDMKAPAPIVLRAEGAVAVSVAPGSAAIDVVVPWLAADVVRSPRWEIAGEGGGAIDATLTPVEPGQVLVGIVSADVRAGTAAAADLFPGKTIVPLALSGSPPLRGVSTAWEALDAVIFDSPHDPWLAELLAEGVSVVVQSDPRPGGEWAWQGAPGRWWVSFNLAGPRGAVHPEIYQPISAWNPGWPTALRQRAVLLILAYCLVVLAMTLWHRPLRAATAVAVVAVVAAASFAWWGTRQLMAWEALASVTISGDSQQQGDHWTYVRPFRARNVAIDWLRPRKPVFASARHLRETNLRLHVSSHGRPMRFTWPAKTGTTLAFLARAFYPVSVGAGAAPGHLPPSPTRELVLENYLAPGDVVLDTSGDDSSRASAQWVEKWPHVFVRRGKP